MGSLAVRPVTIAVPRQIRSITPGHEMNGAEGSLLRMLYDPVLPMPGTAAAHNSFTGVAEVGVDGSTVRVSGLGPGRYADGSAFTVDDCLGPLIMRLRSLDADFTVTRRGREIQITAEAPDLVLDQLRSPGAVPFRYGTSGQDPVGTHPHTSGRLRVAEWSDGHLLLTPNPHHPVRARVPIRLVEITEPEQQRERFAAGDVDVIVVAANEDDVLAGTNPHTRDGRVVSGPANAVSALFVRPRGPLADDEVRARFAKSFPRHAFARRFLGRDGRPAAGFSAGLRDRPTTAAPPGRWARGLRLEWAVPPLARTIERAEWIAEEVGKQTGAELAVSPRGWAGYWQALSSGDTCDLVWAGIVVDHDHPRHWVRYHLLRDWLPLPPPLAAEQRRALADRRSDLIGCEERMLREGWVIPLYHHHQSYLVRVGVAGLHLHPSDWPLPGAGFAERIHWDPIS